MVKILFRFFEPRNERAMKIIPRSFPIHEYEINTRLKVNANSLLAR